MTAAFRMPDSWYEPPATLDATDDPGTTCPYGGGCDGEGVKECCMCGGVVCTDHDDVEDCDGEVVHAKCHLAGCQSQACADDARDDYLIAQDDADRGR